MSSCVGMTDGDYQSCNDCEVFVSCSNENITDNRSCPLGNDGRRLRWDDNTKTCERESQTCNDDGGSESHIFLN